MGIGKRKFSIAESQIKEIDQMVLQELLGENYDYSTDLRSVIRGHTGLPSDDSAIKRREPEVIVLT